jgi:phage baseplate assembly protein W
MLPAYGIDLAGQLFGNPDEVATAVVNDVTVAMQMWEPSVQVKNVSTAPGSDPVTGLVQVQVEYVTPASGVTNPAAVSTATVLVGGSVVEQVSP